MGAAHNMPWVPDRPMHVRSDVWAPPARRVFRLTTLVISPLRLSLGTLCLYRLSSRRAQWPVRVLGLESLHSATARCRDPAHQPQHQPDTQFWSLPRRMTFSTHSCCHAGRSPPLPSSGAPGHDSSAPIGMWSEGKSRHGMRCGCDEPAALHTGIVRSTLTVGDVQIKSRIRPFRYDERRGGPHGGGFAAYASVSGSSALLTRGPGAGTSVGSAPSASNVCSGDLRSQLKSPAITMGAPVTSAVGERARGLPHALATSTERWNSRRLSSERSCDWRIAALSAPASRWTLAR
mmetsp:Transcript_32127/g.88059  ORF Transcript_32127/g.88059 Transcript_32127/m.88059 type:complete len:291 (+) Transcript_32127:189-1061(+)